MKINNFVFLLFLLLGLVLSCNRKEQAISDLQKLRYNTNKKSYPVTKMDSSEAIQFIVAQKAQELMDLSTLYTSGNRDTEIDSVIYAQMKGYFLKSDSLFLESFLQQLDSLNVKSVKVNNLQVFNKIVGNDTLDFAKFKVEYFDGMQNSIGVFEKNAQYVLKTSPVKFKKEFKFYFLKFDTLLPKENISEGQIK